MVINEKYLTGERALFQSRDIEVNQCVFGDGESPLKESENVDIHGSIFKWKYPLWYSRHIRMDDSTLLETARSGIWYTHDISISNSVIEAPKTFRRSTDIKLVNVDMPLAQESFWNCQNVELKNVSARGDYFGMNSKNIVLQDFRLTGNYCFDGAKHIEVHHATLVSKDAFWNCEDVVVYDSTIIGEYLAWNSKNITFVNCRIESLQGLCYIENLKMVNCQLINTTLVFEFCSHVDAQINSHIESIMNPISGVIEAKSIGEIIMEEDKIDPTQTKIITRQSMINQEDMNLCMNC